MIFNKRRSFRTINAPSEIKSNYECLFYLGGKDDSKIFVARGKNGSLKNNKVVIKILGKTQFRPGTFNEVFQKLFALKQLNHPNVIKIYKVYKNADTIAIVMEYAKNGDLQTYLHNLTPNSPNGKAPNFPNATTSAPNSPIKKLQSERAEDFLQQIMSGLEYLNSQYVVTRDLTFSNILLDSFNNNKIIKVASFGLAEFGGNYFLPFEKSRDGEENFRELFGLPPIEPVIYHATRNNETKAVIMKMEKISLIPNVVNQRFRFERLLGRGTFGEVQLAINLKTNKKVAIKIIDKTHVVTSLMNESEQNILKQLDHPNIIKLYEIIDQETTLYLIMEYGEGGDLESLMKNEGKFPQIKAKKYFNQIVCGIEYLHKINVAHGDLKLENILLDSKDNIKLVDFGLSKFFKQDEMLQTIPCSPNYLSPEKLSRIKYDDETKIDIWAMGIIFYLLFTGEFPFNTNDEILKCQYQVPMEMAKYRIIIESMLVSNPNARFAVESIKALCYLNF